MSITRRQLIKQTAQRVNLTDTYTAKVIAAFLDVLTEALLQQQSISLKELGSFTITARKPRTITHPVTGQPITTQPRRTLRYRPSKQMQNRLAKSQPPPTTYAPNG